MMWIATLLTSGSIALGRLVMVGFLPNLILVTTTLALLRAGSFTGRSRWGDVLPSTAAESAVAGLVVLVVVTIMTVLLQPFQIRLVRVVEGYWEGWALTALLAPVFTEMQYRKIYQLRERARGIDDSLNELDLESGSIQSRARNSRREARLKAAERRVERKRMRYPASQYDDQLLPTALGNALRTTETTAGERYGLSTIYTWPRLYPLLPDRIAELYHSATNAIDAAVNLAISFFVTAVLTAVALYDEPRWYWIPLALLALSTLAYTGSIASASSHGLIVRTAYDQHRFALLKAAHLPLPISVDSERAVFGALSSSYEELLPGETPNTPPPQWYKHEGDDAKPT